MSLTQSAFSEEPRVAAPNEPHLACVLLLDTSGSISGEPIESLNRGIRQFIEQTSMDEMAQKRVDVAVIAFDDEPRVEMDFTPVSQMEPVTLTAGGCTAMGAAIQMAIDKVKERSRFYASLGTQCFKPWIFMISDGTPLDQLDLKIKVKRLRSSYEEEVDAGEVAGYDPTVLGAQKLTVTAHGKSCSVKVNVVAVDLATPVVRAENGKLHVEYDKAHTERLVLTINGKEYSYADATEDGYLRESITGDSFTVTAQATSSLSGINDSTVSEPVTLRRTAPSSEGSQESCRCLETRAWRTSRTALW